MVAIQSILHWPEQENDSQFAQGITSKRSDKVACGTLALIRALFNTCWQPILFCTHKRIPFLNVHRLHFADRCIFSFYIHRLITSLHTAQRVNRNRNLDGTQWNTCKFHTVSMSIRTESSAISCVNHKQAVSFTQPLFIAAYWNGRAVNANNSWILNKKTLEFLYVVLNSVDFVSNWQFWIPIRNH